MAWTSWIFASAALLAAYDLFKKASVRENAVLPVLAISTACGAVAYVAAVAALGDLRAVAQTDGRTLSLAACKVLIVGTSWILTFSALRTLPITIATPIRASAPALVVLFAVLLYGERPSAVQWAGVVLVLAGFLAFARAGRAEGIDFRHSRAVALAVGGMVCSAASSLWDKYVFQIAAAPVETVQFHFQLGLCAFYGATLLLTRIGRRTPGVRFKFRPTIPFVGIALAFADWLYFHGLAVPGAPVSLASLLRRFSVVVTFFLGALFFREHNLRRKALALVFVLAGIGLLVAG